MTFCFSSNSNSTDDYAVYFGVDLNGEKGPNVQGMDIFKFKVTESEDIKLFGSHDSGSCDKDLRNSPRNDSRYSEWIMKYWNIDYLHRSVANWSQEWLWQGGQNLPAAGYKLLSGNGKSVCPILSVMI